jgi:hypothetical protein
MQACVDAEMEQERPEMVSPEEARRRYDGR